MNKERYTPSTALVDLVLLSIWERLNMGRVVGRRLFVFLWCCVCLWVSSAPLVAAIKISSTVPTMHLNPSQSQQQEQRYFYVYDTGQWHDIGILSMNKRDDPNEILEIVSNNGAGPLIDAARGLYHTDQYQIFLLNYHRALRDYRRTLDPDKATTFIIPYDFASDVAYYKHCSKSVGSCFDFRKCPMAPTVEELLLTSPHFKRNFGYDHVLFVGNNYAMEHHIGKPKCKAFLSGVCFNCTKFAIDDYSFLHSGDQGMVTKGTNW
jgi:hypothetical protein